MFSYSLNNKFKEEIQKIYYNLNQQFAIYLKSLTQALKIKKKYKILTNNKIF